MSFHSTLLASAVLLSSTAFAFGDPSGGSAGQQGSWGSFNGGIEGGGGSGNGNGAGAWGAFPSCVSSCKDSGIDFSSGSALCDNKDAVNTLQKCVDDSDCSSGDKNSVYAAVAQLCANSGKTITQGPFASVTATSGGSAWPSQWATNSAWVSAASGYGGGGMGGGMGGWSGGGSFGPFGSSGGGPGGKGWGAGPWASSGAWTEGPWTSWWGTSGCPASTWSGWTEGSWSSEAPWTTWTGCEATTTASSVYTTTVTVSGSALPTTTTSYGIKLAQATSSSGSSSNSNGGSGDNNSGNTFSNAAGQSTAFVAAVMGMVGIAGAALLL